MVAQTRGRNVATWGAGLQTVFTGVMVTVWLWTGAVSALPAALFLGGGVLVWLVIAVLFYCRQLERQEQRELDEIAARGGSEGTIFEGEAAGQVRPAAARLLFFDRWVVPIFTLLWAAYHAAIGILMLRYVGSVSGGQITSAAEGAVFLVIIAFLAFLFSRYATGMSRQPTWRLLRAGAGYLLVNVLFVAGVLAALVGAWQGYVKVDLVVAYLIPSVQIVLAVELLVNFVLDLYRPRIPHAEPRASFDSRLFDLLAEPARIGSSMADALNYQFGFEVSKTWFYQLVSRAFVSLIIFGVAVLFAMSSVVVVRQGRQCIVLHWGEARDREVLEAGIHFKWPWPVDTAHLFDTGQVRQFMLGAGEQRTEEEREAHFVNGRELYLWTEEHGEHEELDFLVAVPPAEGEIESEDTAQAPPPVNIINLVVTVQYAIEDVYKFGFKYVEPVRLLEAVASQEMTRYCSSATLDKPIEGAGEDRPEAIMTFGRQKAAQGLRRRIQQAIGPQRLDMGIRILSVNFVGVHPPLEAAPEYEKVLEEERRRDEKRYAAEADANRMLSQVAGDPTTGLQLALAIMSLEQLESLATLESRPHEFERQMDLYIQGAQDDIEALDAEIQRDRLLGRGGEGQDPTARQGLRGAHRRHLEQLKRIAKSHKGGGGVDLGLAIAQARGETDVVFDKAGGRPAALVAEAEAYRWEKELRERARADAFGRELLAYNASPGIYMLDRWLDVWDEVLPGVTKYVLGVDRDRIEIWLNVETDVTGIEGTLIEAEAGAAE